MIFLAFASLLGIPFGFLLGRFAKEELKDTEKYLKYLRPLMPAMILFSGIYFYGLVYALVFSAIILLLSFKIKNHLVPYIASGFVLYFAPTELSSFLCACLVFLYGLFIGSSLKKFKETYLYILFLLTYLVAYGLF